MRRLLYLGGTAILAVFIVGYTANGGSRTTHYPRTCALAFPPSQVATAQLEAVYCHSVVGGQCHAKLGWLVVSEPVACN